MTEFIQSISSPICFLCLVAIFVLLFATILTALRQMSFFECKTTVIVALCVSILCIMGLHQTFLGTGRTGEVAEKMVVETSTQTSEKEDNFGLRVLLLPYSVLAIAMLLAVLLLAIKTFISETPRKHPSGIKQQSPKPMPQSKPDEERYVSK